MWAWSQYIPPSYTGVSHTNLLERLSAFQLKKKKGVWSQTIFRIPLLF